MTWAAPQSQESPLLSDMLKPIRYSIERALDELRTYYKAKDGDDFFRLIIVTLSSSELGRGIFSGTYDLSTPSYFLSYHILNSLFHFLVSHQTVRLNSSFQIHIKTFGLEKSKERKAGHYATLEERRQRMKHYMIGANSHQSPYAKDRWYLAIPNQVGRVNLRETCLLASLVVAHEQLLAYEGDPIAKKFISNFKKCPRKCSSHLQRLLDGFRTYVLGKKARGELMASNSVMDPNYLFSGPQTLADILPLFSEYRGGLQITALSDLISHVCYRYPKDYDQSRRQIYIFVELANRDDCINLSHPDKGIIAGHASVVRDPRMYFNKMGKRCIACLRSLSRASSHICRDSSNRARNCFTCKRFLATETTPLNSQNNARFCKSLLVQDEREKGTCKECGLGYNSEDCLAKHKPHCSKGYKCEKCNIFNHKHGPYQDADALRKVHICFAIFCSACLRYKPRDHLCQTRAARYQKEWCNLAFLRVYYIDESSTSCEECFQLQKLDSLKLCERHTEEETSMHVEPNFAALLVEGPERGTFSEKFFASPQLLSAMPKTRCEQLQCNYFPSILLQTDSKKRAKRTSTESRYQKAKQRNLQAVRNRIALDLDKSDSVLLALVYYILDMRFLNTTIVCHTKTGEEINAIGGIFQLYGFKPKLTSKDNLMISVSLPDRFGIRVINNHQYFRQEIEELNGTFAHLETVLFPYKMNCPQFYTYSGQMPASDKFTSMFSTPEEIVKVAAYITRRSNDIWSFCTELLKFARFEVRVLASCATTFVTEAIDFQRSLLIECDLSRKPGSSLFLPFLHPFSKPYCTIAAYSFDCLKLHTLDTSQLYIWKNEFGTGQASGNPSIEELEYVSFIMDQVGPGPEYHYSFSSEAGQKVLCIEGTTIMPDLYYEGNDGKIYIFDFDGCPSHPHLGCLTQPTTGKNRWKQDRGQLMAKDRRRRQLLESHFGSRLSYTTMHSCTWSKLKKKSEEVKKFMASYIPRPKHRLVPRKAVRGSNTETYIHSYSVQSYPDLVMESIDCVSLYPWAAINCSYPVGEYRILMSQNDISEVHLRDGQFYVGNQKLHGLMQVCMEPPTYTQFPCLIFRNSSERALAGLCYTCIMEENESVCAHRPPNRRLTSTWTVIEIEYALQQGYKLLKIFEVYAYAKSQPILSSYFRFCGSLKIKNSGLPSGIQDKYQYCSNINQQMNLLGPLRVTPGNCNKSDIRRQVCKSMMNEAIGKFSSYNRPKQSDFACTSKELAKLLDDKKFLVEQVFPINENVMQVVRKKVNSVRSTNVRSCSIIHAYLTAYSRLYMIATMEKLEAAKVRIASIDCDGLKVLRPKGCDLSRIIDIGSHFGAFRHDLAPYVIFDYCAIAPRVNSFLMAGPDGLIKSRTQMTSFSIQSITLQQSLNHALYTSMLEDRIRLREQKLLVPQRKFFRTLLKEGRHHIQDYTFSNMIALKRVTYVAENKMLVTRPLGTSIHLAQINLCAQVEESDVCGPSNPCKRRKSVKKGPPSKRRKTSKAK